MVLGCGAYTVDKGGKAQRGTSPPPRSSQVPRPVLVSCLRHACDVRATKGRRQGRPSPPHPPPPPRGRGMRVGGGGEKRPPPPEDNAAGWGGSGRRVRDEPHDRARRGHGPCKPRRGDHRGCERRVERATTAAARHAPPPCRGTGAASRACGTSATKGRRQAPPPPHTPPPPQGWEKQEGRGGQRPPLPRTKRQDGEAARDGPHDRARGKHAPCRPQRGGRRGSERRVGRATTGATRRAPLPSRRTRAAPRASAVPETCLRRRKDSGDAPPSPPPTPTPTKERGGGSGEMVRGHGG